MGTQNFRDGIRKDPSEANNLDNETVSRIAQRKAVKEKPKKTKSYLLTSLFFLFILIPVSILIYVAFFYEPNDTLTSSPPSNEVSMESTIPDAPLVPVAAEEKNSEELAAEAAAAKEAAEKEAAAEVEKQEAERAAAEKQQAETNAAQAEADKQEEQAAAEQQQEAPPAPVAASKTHTVQPGETLYRIAVNTYGSAGAAESVEKIKAANGLNSNEITAGATLVLP